MIAAIDPGKHGCGLAIGTPAPTKELLWAGYVPSGSLPSLLRRFPGSIMEVYLELMRYYSRDKRSVPNDLIDVATQGGILAGRLGGDVELVIPRDWKGTIDGDVMVKRIQQRLTPLETARVELPRATKTLGHNVWDAVGIYLYAVGRL